LVHAVQTTILIALLAAAVFLLYRHECIIDGTEIGTDLGTARAIDALQRPINVTVNRPSIVVPNDPPVSDGQLIHIGRGGRSEPAGHTLMLGNWVSDRNYDPIPLTRLRWLSLNPAVASVDAWGNVTGNTPGTAVVTVTDTGTGAAAHFVIDITGFDAPPRPRSPFQNERTQPPAPPGVTHIQGVVLPPTNLAAPDLRSQGQSRGGPAG